MGLETGTYIDSLNASNPLGSDPKSKGDDHIRLIKSTVLATFPALTGAMTATQDELNILDGATVTTAELNILDGATVTVAELNVLDGITATTAELNILDGVTATAAELNILDGVTSTTAELNVLDGITATVSELNILDGVTATASELNALDGITATVTELNYTDGVTSNIQTQLNAKAPLASPALTGVPTVPTATTGTDTNQIASCAFVVATSLESALPGQSGNDGKYLTTDGANASWGDVIPGLVKISEATASNDATIEFTGIDSTYDAYIFQFFDFEPASTSVLQCRTSTDGGTTFDSSSSNYSWWHTFGANGDGSAGDTEIHLTSSVTAGGSGRVNGELRLFKPSGTNYTGLTFQFSQVSHYANIGVGARLSAADVDAIQFFMSTGNITSGTIRMYGVAK